MIKVGCIFGPNNICHLVELKMNQLDLVVLIIVLSVVGFHN